jgi:hypothetical protein
MKPLPKEVILMEKTDAIIVLGHRLLPGNLPSEDLKRRIDKAVALRRADPPPSTAWRAWCGPSIPCSGSS